MVVSPCVAADRRRSPVEDLGLARDSGSEALLPGPCLPFDVFEVEGQGFVQAAHSREDGPAHKDEGAFDCIVQLTRSRHMNRQSTAPPSDSRGPDVLRVFVALNRPDEGDRFLRQGRLDHPVDSWRRDD